MHEDHLSLQTPEHVELHLELAGIGSRFLAAAIDSLLQVTAMVGLGLALGVGRWLSTGDLSRLGANLAIVAGSAALVIVVYHTAFELLWHGRTPGKSLAGIMVVRDDGAPIGVPEALVRNLLRLIDILPVLYTIGLVAVFISRDNKRVGDIAAGTVVVRAPGGHQDELLEALSEGGVAEAEGAVSPALQALASRLSAQEAAAVVRFLQRRHDLEPENRAGLAERLATALRPRFAGLALHEVADPEEFLETLGQGLG